MSCIIPFPKQNDLSSVPEFLPGENVLAVYPGTTALHKAVVVSTPVEVTYFHLSSLSCPLGNITHCPPFGIDNFYLFFMKPTFVLFRMLWVAVNYLCICRVRQTSK